MIAMLRLLGTFVANLFKSRRRLELENLFLRHQLNIALRRAPRLRLRGGDRALLVWMIWLWPSLLGLSRVVQPDTILRWHRAGFRTYWRCKSRGRPGRPRVSREFRELIRRMGRRGGKAVAFGECMVHGDTMFAEYLGLDYSVALKLHLYHYVFRDLVSYKWFQSSGLNYDPKLHLRHRLKPIDLYVKHTSIIINMIMRMALPWLEPTRYDKTLKKFPNYSELWGSDSRAGVTSSGLKR